MNAKELSKCIPLDPKLPAGNRGPKLKFDVLSDKRGQLTHDKAYAFLELKTFEGERNVEQNHAQFLLDEMLADQFVDTQFIATCWVGNTKYRLNGQHTCWAIIHAPDDYAVGVRFVEYRVANKMQLRNLYGVIDRNMTRTFGHIVKTQLSGTPATANISSSQINKLSSGIRIMKWASRQQRMRHSANEVAAIFRFNAKLMESVDKLVRDNRHVQRAPVIAAMLATFDKAPKKAYEFWHPVCTCLDLGSKDDPRWRLQDLLHNTSIKSGNGKRVVTQEQLYRICITAWNRWRKGKSARLLKSTDKRVDPI